MNLRRYRKNAATRDIFSTVEITTKNLIQPYFVYEGLKEQEELTAITGQKKNTIDSLKKEIAIGLKQGISHVLLFIIPQSKHEHTFSYDFDSKVLSSLNEEFGDSILLSADMCLCSQTKSGHCGILSDGIIDNDASVKVIADKSLIYAQAGADCISPSDMMDNRILAIRKILDSNKLDSTMIMSYSTKFSSNFYGPFRDAADSTPTSGDRKSYQIDFRNEFDAIRSSIRDMEQGADILMVKPAGAYLDTIYKIKTHERLRDYPLAAYQVSGEFQALQVMAQNGLIDYEKGLLETLYAIKRAGADLIITYAANKFREIHAKHF